MSGTTAPTSTTRLRTIVTRWTVFAALVAAGAGILGAQVVGGFAADAVFAGGGFVIYAAMGGLIIGRRDGHRTGWLLACAGLMLVFADGLGRVPGVPAWMGSWVGSWAWSAVFALFAALTLTFPSGHPPRGRGPAARLGRSALWMLPVLVAIGAFAETLGGPETFNETASPVGFLPGWLRIPALIAVILVLLGGVVSLVVKRHRATSVERAQIRWVVFAFVLLITTIVLTMAWILLSIAIGAGDPGDPAWSGAFVVMLLLPVSFGVAVLRYRLYDIDRIVSRTVSYVLVVVLLAIVFVGAVTAFSSLLPAQSDLAIAASTLAVAALFNPLRRRIHARVDRRFNRSRYDAQRVVDRFAASLRDRLDPRNVADAWMQVVTDTMQPVTVAVWRRDRPSRSPPG